MSSESGQLSRQPFQQVEVPMPDNNTIAHPLDAKSINVNDPYEMKLWIKTFECTEVQLKRAVKAVGTSGKAIRKHLKK
jgi:hypothetical protein